ncbi:MAG: Kinesin-like protein kif17 [Marteilia pararefringens]
MSEVINTYEEPEISSNKNIKVLIRIKPEVHVSGIDGRDYWKKQSLVVRDKNTMEVNDQHFEADRIFDQNDSTYDIFEEFGKESMQEFLKGFNVTILAYGQTGCGKSYTMHGNNHSQSKGETGFINQSICEIFRLIKEKKQEKDENEEEYSEPDLKLTFFEIYNESIVDLLGESESKNNLECFNGSDRIHNLYAHPVKGIQITGLTEEKINSPEDCFKMLKYGYRKRSVASTNINLTSSRSHTIATIHYYSKMKNDQEIFCKLNIVDLAGSERQKKSETTGQRFLETTKINLSLSALGNVINALGSNKIGKDKTCLYIPYRSSKLTMALKDSIGGNASSIMIACISSNKKDLNETLNTLRYSARVRNVKNKSKMNIKLPKDELLRIYRLEIDRLNEIIGINRKIDKFQEFDEEKQDCVCKKSYDETLKSPDSLSEKLQFAENSIEGIKFQEFPESPSKYWSHLPNMESNQSIKQYFDNVLDDLYNENSDEVDNLNQINLNLQMTCKLYEELMIRMAMNLPENSNYRNINQMVKDSRLNLATFKWTIPRYEFEEVEDNNQRLQESRSDKTSRETFDESKFIESNETDQLPTIFY